MAARVPASLPWLLAACGFALDLVLGWPGQMSFDPAYAWWQARGGEMTDVVPPGFTLAWRTTLALVDGPQAMLVLQLAMFWSGLALLAGTCARSRAAAVAALALPAFAPLVLLWRMHVWTDVALFCALTCACGLLAAAQVRHRRVLAACAVPLLLYAGAMRHNAPIALLPFAAWCAWLIAGARGARLVACTLLVLAASLGTNRLLAGAAARHVPLWPSAAQYDLAALSIATGELQLPPFMVGTGLDVDELAAAFRIWSPLPMLTGTQHGLRSPFEPPLSAAELDAVRTAWIDAIRAHPRAWLAHRARVAAALFGSHPADWPTDLVYADGEYAYRDNPPVAANDGALHRALIGWFSARIATPWCAAWPYLALGLLVLPLAWRRRDAHGRIALVLLASAWCYAAPLLVLASSAETRYLAWPCVASMLALVAAVTSRARPFSPSATGHLLDSAQATTRDRP